MPEARFLVMTTGGLRMAIPSELVEALTPWNPPHALPLSAPWVAGVLEGEGEAIPVLREGSVWGEAAEHPEVLAIVQWRGIRLAMPGAGLRLVLAEVLKPTGDEPPGPWSCCLHEGDERVPCLDLERLYLKLGLH